MAHRPASTPGAAARAKPNLVVSVLAIGWLVLSMGTLSAMLCWGPARRLWDEHVTEAWPVVDGTITAAQITWTHRPNIGKHLAWTGWCLSWNYTYDWQGARLAGTVDDLTPSTLSTGCFSYREGAERAAARRVPGSTLPIRLDPMLPWQSTANAAGIHRGDVVEVILGALPAAFGLGLVLNGLRLGWRKRRQASAV